MANVNWVGFYVVRNDALILGPFQGKIACVTIARGKGVCGTAWDRDETVRVPDVRAFPGHIACDASSRSEIVLPVHDRAGVVRAVLDIDSTVPDRFSEEDEAGLRALITDMETYITF